MYKITTLIVLFLLTITPNLMAVSTDGLVGAWLFDDGTGSAVADRSGNSLDGEVTIGDPIWVDGKFGGALEFGGSDMVTVSDNDALDLTSFTIAAWINSPTTSGVWHIIAAKEARNPTGRNYGIFGHVNTGAIHYSFTSAGWKSFDASTNVTDGTWHHVAATYENPNFKLYIDGEVDAEVSPAADPESNDSPLYIGGCDIGNYWMTGAIDEVVLYSRALSEAEIADLIADGMVSVTPVEPAAKLVTTWSQIKAKATR